MIASEIFIENQKLDVSSEISSLLNFAIDDIKDFSSRNTTFSKTIVLPGTANNNALFGHVFDAKISNPYDESLDNVSTNFNASVGAECLIFQDAIQVFKGTMRLLEIIITDGVPEYEVAVFGELGGLVAALGIGKLEDLDFSAYDHVLNVSGITASWDNPGGSGIYYPLIDTGNVSNNKVDYDFTAFRPALYVKEYIEKIFDYAGYSFTAPLFDTQRFKNLIIPFSQRTLRSLETNLLIAGRTTRYIVLNGGALSSANLKFETFSGAGFTANANKDEFTYTDVATLNCQVYFRITGDYHIPIAAGADFHFQVNGVTVPGYSKFITTGSGTYVWTFTFNLTLNTSDVITFFYDGSSPFISSTVHASVSDFTIQSLVPVFAPAGIGDTIEMNTTLPKNILQKDFLSSIIKLFNLYVYEDVNSSKKVLIKPYVDFFDLNVSGVTDWNYKMDRGKAIRLKPMSELNSRYYNFKFKPDVDFYNENYKKRYNESYGDRLYDSQFEFTNERTDIELIFSPTVLVGYDGVDKIVSVFYKMDASGIEQEIDVNIRILQTKKITGVTPWDILDITDVLEAGLTDYGYAGHYDDPDAPANDIHFGVPKELFFILASGAPNVTQFNVYWSSYMAEITDKDSKLLTAFFKLTNKDIYGLDFSKFIHVDGSYWRLNKIEDWNASEPDVCKCELLKLINMIY